MQWSKRSKTNSKICKSKKIYWGEYMELWDAYDESFNKLDCAPLIRGQVIPNGVFHLVCEALVRHTDGTYLIMQRDFHKHLGGMWEATAGGSALQGEQPIDCAKRELLEGTGIIPSSIKQVGTVVHKQHHSIYCEFICITETNKNAIRLQDGETIAYKWVTQKELLSMSKDELATTRIQKYISDK